MPDRNHTESSLRSQLIELS